MTNFEEACKMSAEKWVASFPDEVEAHKFSQKHIDAINEIIYPKPAHKVKSFQRKQSGLSLLRLFCLRSQLLPLLPLLSGNLL